MINNVMLRSLKVVTLKLQTCLNHRCFVHYPDDVTSVVDRSHITMHPLYFQFSCDSSRERICLNALWAPCSNEPVCMAVRRHKQTNKHTVSLSITFGKVSWQQLKQPFIRVFHFGQVQCADAIAIFDHIGLSTKSGLILWKCNL